MSKTKLQTEKNIYSQQQKPSKNKPSLQNIRQDNSRFSSARAALRQPAPVNKVDRAQSLDNAMVCSHFPNSHENRTVKLTLWVKPRVKDAIDRLAKGEKLSLSAAGAFCLERFLQINTDLQYTALLEPVIGKSINKNLRQFKKANTHLLVRIAYDVGQIRGIVTNILGNQLGNKQDLIRTILDESARSAKNNITRNTPQLAEIIEKIEKWLMGEEESGK